MAETKKQPQLFEYALFWLPNEEQVKKGDKPKMIVNPKTIIAIDEASAAKIAIREIPKEHDEDIDQVQVAVRPF